MKLFEKIINNQLHCKPASKIILIKGDMQIFNPSEEMLLEDGWIEHVHISSELSDNEVLEIEKEHLKDNILQYDSSDEINIFYVNEIPVWLDKVTRTGLMLRFQSEIAMNKTNTSLWYNGIEFPLILQEGVQMLYLIENYASSCYDNTQRHLLNVSNLETLEDIKNYDYRSGYPEILKF